MPDCLDAYLGKAKNMKLTPAVKAAKMARKATPMGMLSGAFIYALNHGLNKSAEYKEEFDNKSRADYVKSEKKSIPYNLDLTQGVLAAQSKNANSKFYLDREDLGIVDYYKLSFTLFGYNTDGFIYLYYLLLFCLMMSLLDETDILGMNTFQS